MWVDYKPVDVEIDDDNTGIFHAFYHAFSIHFSFSMLLKQR